MKKVYEYLQKEINLLDKDIIVIGCSGGPDSMALMYILQEIRKNKDLLLVCAHINHNVRVESKQEEEFLKQYCLDNNIVFESMTIQNYGDDNFHNEARKIRYQFFEEIVNKYKAKYLMTAHHGDDLIETILMRMVRGSTLKGYAGFEKSVKKENYTLIRPLIFATKEQIEKYNISKNIPYVIDKSNFKGKYTRNRYRKEVLPFLRQEEPVVHEKFLKFSDTLIEYSNYIDRVLSKVINKIYNNDTLNIEKFLKEEPLIQKKIIYYIMEIIYNDDLHEISSVHVGSILKLINSKRPNGSINLPGKIKVIRSYNELKFLTEIENICDYEIEISERVDLPGGHYIKVVDSDDKNDNNVCRISSNEVEMPLYVRTRRLGDTMMLKKINGKKKIKDIFIDSKIPLNQRDKCPIVVDGKGNIIWIPGIKKSKFCKQKTEKYDIIFKYN